MKILFLVSVLCVLFSIGYSIDLLWSEFVDYGQKPEPPNCSSSVSKVVDLPKCQFQNLVRTAVDLPYQGRNDNNADSLHRVGQCLADLECLGIYQDQTTRRWRKLSRVIQDGRRPRNENCNAETVKVEVITDRFNIYNALPTVDQCASFSKAVMPTCQFNLLAQVAGEISDQNDNCGDCLRDSTCLGVFQEGGSGRWRKIRRLPGRKFYEENCNANSQRIGFQILVLRSRLESIMKCDGRFGQQGSGNSFTRYWHDGSRINWSPARSRCIQEGAKLAEITTPDELNAVRRFLGGSPEVWVGAINRPGSNSKSRGNWIWVTSNLPASQDWLWVPREPTGHSSSGVGQLWRNAQLDDIVMNDVRGYLCECQDPIVIYV